MSFYWSLAIAINLNNSTFDKTAICVLNNFIHINFATFMFFSTVVEVSSGVILSAHSRQIIVSTDWGG